MKPTMKPQPALLALYHRARREKPFMHTGQDATCSLRTAKTILAFREAEKTGLVRLRAEEEQENYFDVYGEPDGYINAQGHHVSAEKEREEIIAILERDGCWWTCAEWFDGEEWQMADSCGMHTGYSDPLDPFQNCYIVDEMQSALDALTKFQEEQTREAQEAHHAACRDVVTV